MAAKRSPILGYNHNVRFRGIVFHIQTEDSGIVNPHVFSHLFHGGVILSTRKLVYDAGANEDAVKSLMQAQHKAVMKDLRRGAFDDKIDSYLADAPGLLPRESAQLAATVELVPAVAEATPAPIEIEPAITEPVSMPLPPSSAGVPMPRSESQDDSPVLVIGPPLPAPDPIYYEEPSAPAIEVIQPEESSPAIELIDPKRRAETTGPVVTISYQTEKAAAFIVEDDDLYDAAPVPDALGRAPTERFGAPPAPTFSLEDEPGSSAELVVPPDEPPPPPKTRTDISAALSAIQVSDEDLAAALSDDIPVEIHSPALPSAPQPPGAAPDRIGEYHLARKPAVVEAPPPPPARPPIPRPTPVSSRVPTPSSGRPPVMPSARPPTTPRPATPPPAARAPTPPPTPARASSNTFRAQTPPPPGPPPRAATQIQGSASSTPVHGAPSLTRPTPQSPVPRAMAPAAPTATPATARAPIAPPRRPATGGGVVVSRPAVIVGGKNPTNPPPKVRRAKDAESFGGDLISERSLDEVILAYLSEDNSEE